MVVLEERLCRMLCSTILELRDPFDNFLVGDLTEHGKLSCLSATVAEAVCAESDCCICSFLAQ